MQQQVGAEAKNASPTCNNSEHTEMGTVSRAASLGTDLTHNKTIKNNLKQKSLIQIVRTMINFIASNHILK